MSDWPSDRFQPEPVDDRMPEEAEKPTGEREAEERADQEDGEQDL